MKIFTLAAAALLSGAAFAQGPDVTTFNVGVDINTNDNNDFAYYGTNVGGAIHAYAIATTSCNEGNQTAIWVQSPNPNHPVIGTNMYRLKDGRFEQVGQAWLKHSFCAVSEPGCGSCSATSCSTLGIGCADTYWATLNGGQSGLGPRFEINPTTGTNGGTHTTPSGNNTIRGRIQVKDADVRPNQNSGAVYFWEAQYIAADDAAAGNGLNNVSHRKFTINTVGQLPASGGTQWHDPAVFGWRNEDPQVIINKVLNFDEGGSGVHGQFWIAYRVYDNGNGTWDYEYALYNMNSDRSAGSFTIPIGNNVNITNVGFHDVDYHSGEPYVGTNWSSSVGGSDVTWATQTFAQNVNANAIRWGTMYNFRFTADTAPQNASATVGLFKPGTPNDLSVIIMGPMDGSGAGTGTAFCLGDGSGNSCPCGNTGGTGEGCATTTGSGITAAASGSTSIAADDLVMTAMGVPLSNTGIFYAGKTQLTGNPLFDGLQCTSGNVVRFSGQFASTSTVSDTGFVAQDLFGLFFVPGDSYFFQYFTRDNQAGPSPCGGFANLSNGVAVMMTL